MNLTPNFAIPEPEGQDFGNGALQLQGVAESADSYIWGLQQAFQSSLRTAAFVAHATGSYTVPLGQPLLPFDGDANLFNFGAFVMDYANVFTDPRLIPEQGSYLFGCFVQLIAATPTTNTLRTLQIGASVPSGPQFTSQKQYLFSETGLEPGNGLGVSLCASGQFDYQAVPGARPLQLWAGFSHTNTGSSVVMQASAISWAIKISEIGE